MQQATAEKLNRIQSLFDEGKTHEEIAKELGYTKIESFYRYIYRYDDSLNYRKLFNKKSLSVVPKEDAVPESKCDKAVEAIEAIPQTKENISKVESVVSLISRGVDVRDVAKKKHFKDMQELANYMKSKGYIWSSSAKNYVLVPQEKQMLLETRASPDGDKEQETKVVDELRDIMYKGKETNCDCLERYGAILMLLEDKKDKLIEILNGLTNQGKIPRYIIPGEVITKSVKMVSTLQHLMNDFCEVANITQKMMLEVAIIDFLKKYGYGREVKTSLQI